MSGKKSSLGKNSMPVVARVRSQKPDRPSPVQDHKKRDSGGLLSLQPVHAGRRDGEDLEDGGARFWNGGARPCVAYMFQNWLGSVLYSVGWESKQHS